MSAPSFNQSTNSLQENLLSQVHSHSTITFYHAHNHAKVTPNSQKSLQNLEKKKTLNVLMSYIGKWTWK